LDGVARIDYGEGALLRTFRAWRKSHVGFLLDHLDVDRVADRRASADGKRRRGDRVIAMAAERPRSASAAPGSAHSADATHWQLDPMRVSARDHARRNRFSTSAAAAALPSERRHVAKPYSDQPFSGHVARSSR
jgi:hypothetical protein